VYTIGEISKIVKISTNALRYYDEIGLLKPVAVKNDNQYRYYSDEQVKDIMFITELKQYGFSLGEIKDLIKNKDNKKLKQMLEQKFIEVNDNIMKLKQNSKILERRISELIKEELEMKGGRILIVDDLELVRKMIKSIIEEHGYICAGEAYNGEEAIEAYEELKPDLIIMDITMPKMDGIYAMGKIINKHKDARIIMCSGMSNPQIILESINAGARDFVSKPISSFRLIEAIERGLDNNFSICKVKDNINQISSSIKDFSGGVHNITLSQEEIDLLLNMLLQNEGPILDVLDYIKSLKCKQIDAGYHLNRSVKLEVGIITLLRDKFSSISKKLATYIAHKLGQSCFIQLLTVESITLSEFKTLISSNSHLAIINYKMGYSPVYINVYGSLENEMSILKEILRFGHSEFQVENGKGDNIIIGSEEILKLNEDYSTVLVSYSIEFDKENKGFVAISLPLSLL
jgi:two-component system chemotaxis response regulator CheY